MKIAFVFGYSLGIGGHFKSAAAMARYLVQQGHTVRVLAPCASADHTEFFAHGGVEVTCVPGLGTRRTALLPGTARRLLDPGRLDQGFDLIQALDYRALAPSYLAAALGHKPLVVSIAGGPPSSAIYPRHSPIVVFSEELYEAYRTRPELETEDLYLVRARIDTQLFRPQPVADGFLERLSLERGRPTVVLASRLEESKRPWIETFFGAAQRLAGSRPTPRLVVAGDGPLIGELRSRAAGLGSRRGDPILSFIGPVRALDPLVQLYCHADLVVGSGRGILEAMACGRPTVVLGERGEGEVVDGDSIAAIAYANFSGRHFRGRAAPGDPLPDLLARLLADPRARSEIARFSLDYVREHMDARAGAEQLSRVHEQAAGSPASLRHYADWMARAGARSGAIRLRRALRGGGSSPGG